MRQWRRRGPVLGRWSSIIGSCRWRSAVAIALAESTSRHRLPPLSLMRVANLCEVAGVANTACYGVHRAVTSSHS